METGTYRLEDLNGRLLSYERTSGNSSLYIPVTFELDNRGDLLPGAFAEIFLLGEERNGVISLPVSALTEEQVPILCIRNWMRTATRRLRYGSVHPTETA